MSDFERIFWELGAPIFVSVGGEDWAGDARLGGLTVALTVLLFAMVTLAVAVRTSHR